MNTFLSCTIICFSWHNNLGLLLVGLSAVVEFSLGLSLIQHQILLPSVYLCSVPNLCPTLCDPMDGSPPDSSVHGILQARILKRVAISSSRNLLDPGIKYTSLMAPALANSFTTEAPGKPLPTCKSAQTHLIFYPTVSS